MEMPILKECSAYPQVIGRYWQDEYVCFSSFMDNLGRIPPSSVIVMESGFRYVLLPSKQV